MKSLLICLCMVLASATASFGQTVPTDENVLRNIHQWKASISAIDPANMNVSYAAGKLIADLRETCVGQLNAVEEGFHNTTDSLFARSRVLRHLDLATQCVDELGLSLSNPGIMGMASQEALTQRVTELFGQMMKMRITLENDLDGRILRQETACARK